MSIPASRRPARRRSPRSRRWWSRSARCVVILFLPTQFALDLQLLGGVWILQTLPGGGVRPVHRLVPRAGAARRLGRRPRRRHLRWPSWTASSRCTPSRSATATTRSTPACSRSSSNIVVASALPAVARTRQRSQGLRTTRAGSAEPGGLVGEQAAPPQMPDGRLDRRFREAGADGDRLQARRTRSRRDRARGGSQIQVDEEGRRLPVVPDQVGHEDVDDIDVERQRSNRCHGREYYG